MRKILRKSQPNFKHYVRKIETLAKSWFSYIKKRITEIMPSLKYLIFKVSVFSNVSTCYSKWKTRVYEINNKAICFFICNISISNARLILSKNQANVNQHPEAWLLLFKNYSHSSSALPSKNSTYSKKQAKKQICLYSTDYTFNHNGNENKNGKEHIDTTWVDQGLDMDTNMRNIKRVSLWWCLQVLNNT